MMFHMPSNPSALDQSALELWLLLLKTTFRLRSHIRPIFAQRGLTGPQWRVFRMLGESPEGSLTPGQVSDHLGVTGGNTTGIVDKLEEAGLVQRLPHPEDRRATLLQLTATGREMYAHVRPVFDERVTDLLSCLSEDEKQQTIALLGRVLSSLPAESGCNHEHRGS
jgi:DNA-binding MarR family transcriptional regulator